MESVGDYDFLPPFLIIFALIPITNVIVLFITIYLIIEASDVKYKPSEMWDKFTDWWGVK